MGQDHGRRVRRGGRASGLLTATAAIGAALATLPVAGSAAAAGGLAVTEVAPWASGNSPYSADWFELTNSSAATIDLTGWKVDDSSNSFASAVTLTGVGSIAPGESVIFLESSTPAATSASFVTAWFGGSAPSGLQIGTYTGSGLGLSTGGDGVNVFDATGAARAGVTFGTSPAAAPFATFDNAAGIDGAVSTLSVAGVNGAVQVASSPAAIGSPGTIVNSSTPTTTTSGPSTTAAPTTTVAPASPWPGASAVTDASSFAFGGNMSGLVADTPGVLWGVRNGPGALFRLVWTGTAWAPDSGDWAAGKLLRYPSGTGDPDAEGVTVTDGGPAAGVYVATERNNLANTVSKNAVLRFDPAGSGTSLTANAEWDLTADLPANGPNLGLEAITWVPDSYLVAEGFRDQALNKLYDPADHPGHGTGLFLVGVEATGTVYVYALGQSGGSYTRIASFPSGFSGIMDLQFDRDLQQLWAVCDNTCNGRHAILTVGASGTFGVAATYERPAGMANLNNEGFALAPQSTCVNDRKAVWWADDGETSGVAVRGGDVPCTAQVAPPVDVPEFPVVVLPALLGLGLVVVATRRRRPTSLA